MSNNYFSQLPDDKYQFIKEPPRNFLCPVTCDLLLHPHQTMCCGNHLSEGAAARLQREGAPCPLCTSSEWTTMPDKYFQREVKAVHVFCQNKESGCGWKGELANFEHHIPSCKFKVICI